MGSTSHNTTSLGDVAYRERTLTALSGTLNVGAKQLAAAGFYSEARDDEIKCHKCDVVVNCVSNSSLDQIQKYHVENKPQCPLANLISSSPSLRTTESSSEASAKESNCGGAHSKQNVLKLTAPICSKDGVAASPSGNLKNGYQNSSKSVECKGFNSFDSLRYERERLATFIDWPHEWLGPQTLAKEGFYYLREKDHCSCVFCRGIVGSWEIGDVPSQEHKTHFPLCLFNRGQPVGNIPIEQGDLLASLPIEGPIPRISGIERSTSKRARATCVSPTNTETSASKPGTPEHPVDGMVQYFGPRRKDYLSVEARLKSFKGWPAQVKQIPKDLAEAGFFYCGLSDHVRCYHCSNGLRNWESEDVPWVEHARWYPNCNFVLLSRGMEFIDQVRRENPPYYRSNTPSPSSKTSQNSPLALTASPYVTDTYTSDLQSNYRVRITEQQLDVLMQLDVVKAVLEMKFPLRTVRKALRQKIETTGVPFYTLEACTERVLMCAEKDSEDEAEQQQEAKLSAFQRDREQRIRQSHEESLSRSNENSNTIQLPQSSSHPRTPIITSPVMPLRRMYSDVASASSDEEDTNGSITPTANTPRNINLFIGDNIAVAEAMVTSSPRTERANSSYSITPLDILEYPLINNSRDEAGMRDDTPTNEHSESAPTTSEAMIAEASPNLPSPSSADARMDTSDPATQSPGHTAAVPLTLADPSSRQIINQADMVIEKQKQLCRKFSSGSSKSVGEGSASSQQSTFGEPSTVESSDEGNTSMSSVSDTESETTEEKLAQSRKEVIALREQLERDRESRMCKVCMDADMNVVFLPCTHMATCTACTLSIDTCPICRARIVHAIKPNIVF